MRVQAGLRQEDWQHWGERTTFKRNAAELLHQALRPDQVIYCSPLTDPYQPAEAEKCLFARSARRRSRATLRACLSSRPGGR